LDWAALASDEQMLDDQAEPNPYDKAVRILTRPLVIRELLGRN
jgi:hypothetical protein